MENKTAILKYDLNGLIDKDDKKKIEEETPIPVLMKFEDEVLTAPKYKKKGCKFICWNTDPERDGTDFKAGDVFKAAEEVPEDTTLYAIWKKKNRLIPLIILLCCIILALLAGLWWLLNQEHETAVVEPIPTTEMQDTSSGQIRIKVNSTVNIIDGTMQDLNLQNVNENRLMKCMIKYNGDYIYKSQFIEAGSMITADFINDEELKKGKNEAIAEMYTYDPQTKEKIGQVNAKLILIKK